MKNDYTLRKRCLKIVLLCLLFCPVYSVAAMQSRVVVKGKAISLRDAVRQIVVSLRHQDSIFEPDS